jgi:hypothetical protein
MKKRYHSFASSQKYLDGREVEHWLASSRIPWQVPLFVTARDMIHESLSPIFRTDAPSSQHRVKVNDTVAPFLPNA